MKGYQDSEAIYAQLRNPFMGPIRTNNRTPKPTGEERAKEKGLNRYEVGGSVVYARNEVEAIKRAKKRGLWQEGLIPKPL